MNPSRLASKKNVILLAAVAVVIVFMVGSYYAKQSRLQKQAALGGEVEFFLKDWPLSRHEFGFIKFHASKISHVVDLVVSLPIANVPFEATVRAFDNTYPLRGKMDIDRKQFKAIFVQNFRTKNFGVAVNQLFLNQSGMKFGESFKIGNFNFQIRGLVAALPDASGQELVSTVPFVMMKHWMKPKGMFEAAGNRRLYYRALSKKLSAEDIEQEFRKKFPKSVTAIRRWDQ